MSSSEALTTSVQGMSNDMITSGELTRWAALIAPPRRRRWGSEAHSAVRDLRWQRASRMWWAGFRRVGHSEFQCILRPRSHECQRAGPTRSAGGCATGRFRSWIRTGIGDDTRFGPGFAGMVSAVGLAELPVGGDHSREPARVGLRVSVGVRRADELAVREVDLGGGRCVRDAENVVWIGGDHGDRLRVRRGLLRRGRARRGRVVGRGRRRARRAAAGGGHRR